MSAITQLIKRCMPDTIKYAIKDSMDASNNRKMVQKHESVKPYKVNTYPYGINLIGDVRAETGLGESMRLVARLLEENQIPFVIIPVEKAEGLVRENNDWEHRIVEKPRYQYNVLHINSSDWAKTYVDIPAEWLDYRYNIAYWLWELERFPDKWKPCIDTIDAIWAPSDFICNSIRKCTDKPILKVPYSIRIKTPVSYDREHFKLPEDNFLYLVMYDFKSISERKNPKGMISAFKAAYTVDEANERKVGLVIKINHLDNPDNLEQLKRELAGYQYIYYITSNLSRSEVESLMANVDVLLSLHRSEGFGLPPAEAMYLGTPIVATNWSATTEFMTEDTACLVDYQLISIEKQIGPYKKGNRWADADVKHAAEHMRKLYEDKDYYSCMQDCSQKHIRKCLDSKEIGDVIKEYLEKLEN